MATPIIKIPVDDEAFKKFLETFNDYKMKVASLPEIWKDTNEEVVAQIVSAEAVVSAIDKQTRAILKQQEVLAKETKELEKQEKLEDKQEKAAKKARSDQAKANKKAVEDTKKIAGNIAQATINIVKWGALDFVAAGALDLWGIGTLSKNVTTQFGASLGVGSSVGQRQAFMQTFQPFFDATAALEHAAEAQTDVTKSIPYRVLGLNPSANQDPAQLAIDTILAARRRLQGVPKQNQLLVARALGLDQIMSPDELRTAINAPPGFLEWEARRQREIAPQLEIPIGTMEKFTKLSQDLQIAGRKIETYFVNKLVSLAPGLDKLTDTFVRVADHIIDLIDWQNLGTDLNKFADYVSGVVSNIDWKQVQQDLAKFGTGVSHFVEQVDWDLLGKRIVAFGAVMWATAEDMWVLTQWVVDKLNKLHLISPAIGAATGSGTSAGNLVGNAVGNLASDLTGQFGNWASAFDKALTNLHVPFVYRNNPGNIRPVGASSGFMSYTTLGQGIAALARQDIYKQDHYGAKTLADVIRDYAGNTGEAPAYIKYMSGALGLDPNSLINLHNTDTLAKFLSAQMRLETGKNILTAATIESILKGQDANISTTASTTTSKGGRYVRPPIHNHRVHVAVTVNDKAPSQTASVSQ